MKRNLFAVLALSAVAAAAVPATALANTSAGAKVVNVVEVTYSDTSGKNTFTAAASTSTTVNLVQSALNATTAPSDGIVAGLGCLGAVDTVSGGTVSAIYALSATANGPDTYNLSIKDYATGTANVTDITRTYSTLTYNGTVEETNPVSRLLGSAIPVGVKDFQTLLFPGGALSGFEANDIVLVEVAEGGAKVKRAFKVLGVDPGTPASHANNDGVTGYTTGKLSEVVAEKQGTLTLGAYENTTVTLNGSTFTFGGNDTDPAFTTPATAPTLGVPVGEVVLVKVDITASASSVTDDGTVGYTLTATNGSNSADLTCTASFYKRSQLSIQKEVRNATTNGTWGGTATGNPQEVLEYRITVKNIGGQAAKVSIKDAVPAYTTLVTNGNNFATITDALNKSVTVTTAVDAEGQPTSVNLGFGDAVPTDPNRAINFYLGDTSSNTAGGTVPSCSNATSVATKSACETGGGTWLDTYTILYQVKID